MNLTIYVKPTNVSVWKNHPTYENAKLNEDSGLDIPMSNSITVPENAHSFSIDLGYKAEQNYGYMLIPRSSLAKTPLRLANSVGIIDKNYRGKVIAKVDNISDKSFDLIEGKCYFQIIAFNGILPTMVIVDYISKTNRNTGGFGSTTDFQF